MCVYYIRKIHAGQMKVRAITFGTSFISLFNCVCVYYIRKNHAGQMKVRAITFVCVREGSKQLPVFGISLLMYRLKLIVLDGHITTFRFNYMDIFCFLPGPSCTI